MANNTRQHRAVTTNRRRLLDEVTGRILAGGFDAPAFSGDEYLAMLGHTPHRRQEVADATGMNLAARLYNGRQLIDAVRQMAKEPEFIERIERQFFEMVTERGAVTIKPSTRFPSSHSVFVMAAPYDYQTEPGEMREMPFETAHDAANYLAYCVFKFLDNEYGTPLPAAKRISRPHLTIIGGMLKAMADVNFIPEHPNTLREPPHLMALQSLGDLLKRYPPTSASTRQ